MFGVLTGLTRSSKLSKRPHIKAFVFMIYEDDIGGYGRGFE